MLNSGGRLNTTGRGYQNLFNQGNSRMPGTNTANLHRTGPSYPGDLQARNVMLIPTLGAQEYNQLGDDSVQHNGDSQSGRYSMRKAKPMTVVPMKIVELVAHREEDGPLLWHGREVGFVKLIGQVSDFEETETRVTYRIDDRSSSILLLQYKEGKNEKAFNPKPAVNNDTCDIKRGDFIGVIGSFKPGGQEKAVLVLKIWKINSQEEVDFHKLTLVYNEIREAKLEQKRMFTAKSQISGGLSLPALQVKNSSYYEKVSVFGGRQTQLQLEATQFSFLENMEPYVKDVLLAIRNFPTEEGISHQELGVKLKLANDKLSSSLNFLMEEGHIYCTIDDYHFKSTDI